MKVGLIWRNYFETQKVPAHLQKDKKMFIAFGKATQVEFPADLENKLIKMIDAKEEEEKRFFHRNKSRRNWRWISITSQSPFYVKRKGADKARELVMVIDGAAKLKFTSLVGDPTLKDIQKDRNTQTSNTRERNRYCTFRTIRNK